MHLPRSSGLLLHVTSLPGPYGIGDLGLCAHRFAAICADNGQAYWQMLPICPTGFGYSPYASPSSFAGSPTLISPDLLVQDGLLSSEACTHGPQWESHLVDYLRVMDYKRHLLEQAWQAFQSRGELEALVAFAESEDYWLRDHVAFCVQKANNGGKAWPEWAGKYAGRGDWAPDAFRRSPEGYFVFEQFVFAQQWSRLRDYCHTLGVSIIGDLPIYVAHDSSDVWAFRDEFQLDSSGMPTVVAGVPPDFFSRTGQRWGNPIYDWEQMARRDYAWWTKRMQRALDLFDIIRLDHFRGFAGYWEIPASQPTAEIGRWVNGPGAALFSQLEADLGPLPLIAEDLGVVTPDVPALMQQFGLQGMVVLQFGFDSDEDNPHLPHNYVEHLVAYTGTHDNDTLMGWWEKLPDGPKNFAREYLTVRSDADVPTLAIQSVMSSSADLVITPVQDVLGLSGHSRMNTPGTIGDNWTWRLTQAQLKELADAAGNTLSDWTARTGRLHTQAATTTPEAGKST